jgi:hypothetical protein
MFFFVNLSYMYQNKILLGYFLIGGDVSMERQNHWEKNHDKYAIPNNISSEFSYLAPLKEGETTNFTNICTTPDTCQSQNTVNCAKDRGKVSILEFLAENEPPDSIPKDNPPPLPAKITNQNSKKMESNLGIESTVEPISFALSIEEHPDNSPRFESKQGPPSNRQNEVVKNKVFRRHSKMGKDYAAASKTYPLVTVDPNVSVLGELPVFTVNQNLHHNPEIAYSNYDSHLLTRSPFGSKRNSITENYSEQGTPESPIVVSRTTQSSNNSTGQSSASEDIRLNRFRQRRSSSFLSRMKYAVSKLHRLTTSENGKSPPTSGPPSAESSQPEKSVANVPIVPILKSPSVSFHENKNVLLVPITKRRYSQMKNDILTQQFSIENSTCISTQDLNHPKVTFKTEVEVIPTVESRFKFKKFIAMIKTTQNKN